MDKQIIGDYRKNHEYLHTEKYNNIYKQLILIIQ